MLITRRIQEDFFRLFNCIKYYFIINEIFGERCGPLKMMKPVLENFKTKVGKGTNIIKIYTDKNQQVALNFKINGL